MSIQFRFPLAMLPLVGRIGVGWVGERVLCLLRRVAGVCSVV